MEKLRIYNTAIELVVEVYELVRSDKQLLKDFSLCDQLKRAAVSVGANIAEGYCRSGKQFKHYLEISSGSSNEMVLLLTVVSKVYNIHTDELVNKYQVLGRQILSFSKTISN